MSFDKDSWEAQRALVKDTLGRVADKLEEHTELLAKIVARLDVLDVKMAMIAFVTALVVSGAVSGLIGIIFFQIKK